MSRIKFTKWLAQSSAGVYMRAHCNASSSPAMFKQEPFTGFNFHILVRAYDYVINRAERADLAVRVMQEAQEDCPGISKLKVYNSSRELSKAMSRSVFFELLANAYYLYRFNAVLYSYEQYLLTRIAEEPETMEPEVCGQDESEDCAEAIELDERQTQAAASSADDIVHVYRLKPEMAAAFSEDDGVRHRRDYGPYPDFTSGRETRRLEEVIAARANAASKSKLFIRCGKLEISLEETGAGSKIAEIINSIKGLEGQL